MKTQIKFVTLQSNTRRRRQKALQAKRRFYIGKGGV